MSLTEMTPEELKFHNTLITLPGKNDLDPKFVEYELMAAALSATMHYSRHELANLVMELRERFEGLAESLGLSDTIAEAAAEREAAACNCPVCKPAAQS